MLSKSDGVCGCTLNYLRISIFLVILFQRHIRAVDVEVPLKSGLKLYLGYY